MKKAIGPDGKGNAAEQLGLKELMLRLKRCVENTKSQILREHALGTIASILRHRGKANPFKVPYSPANLGSLIVSPSLFVAFVGLLHDQLQQLVQAYTSSGASNLRDWASALMKNL